MSYIKTYKLFESVLKINKDFENFLDNNTDLFICAELKKLLNIDSIDNINFFKPFENDSVVYSKDDDRTSNTFDWVKQKDKSQIKIGRLVRKLLTDNDIKFNDTDIEVFVNKWKAWFADKSRFKFDVVSGEAIRFWYSSINYHDDARYNTLGKSCMSGHRKQNYLDIYVENPDAVQMVILLDNKNRLLARALLWKTNIGLYLDRIYYTYPENENQIINYINKLYHKRVREYVGFNNLLMKVMLEK